VAASETICTASVCLCVYLHLDRGRPTTNDQRPLWHPASSYLIHKHRLIFDVGTDSYLEPHTVKVFFEELSYDDNGNIVSVDT